MKIVDIKTSILEIPFTKPITINGHKIDTRPIAVIEIIDAEGNTGLGEIAPLPHLHKESFEQALANFNDINNEITAGEITSEMCPSVANAVDVAFYDLSTKQTDFSIRSSRLILPVNGLLVRDTDNICRSLENMLNAGFTSVKIKVGGASLEDDIQIVKRLTGIADGRAKLRLDANRQWTLKDALKFTNATSSETIEYIEEPLKDISNLPQFLKKSEIPLALDETLVEKGMSYATQIPDVKAWILKPSLIGGLEKCRALIKYARKNNITPVISAVFETSISIRIYALFAIKMGLAGTEHGLDTLKFLQTDTLAEPVKIEDGAIDVLKLFPVT